MLILFLVSTGFYNGNICRPSICQLAWHFRNDWTGVSAVTLLWKLLPPIHQQLKEQGRLLSHVSYTVNVKNHSSGATYTASLIKSLILTPAITVSLHLNMLYPGITFSLDIHSHRGVHSVSIKAYSNVCCGFKKEGEHLFILNKHSKGITFCCQSLGYCMTVERSTYSVLLNF